MTTLLEKAKIFSFFGPFLQVVADLLARPLKAILAKFDHGVNFAFKVTFR